MSKATQKFFENLKDAAATVAPGLKNLVPEVSAELSRLGTQGAAEIASGLFNGSGFVPYGPGQIPSTPEQTAGVHGKEEPQQECGIER